MKLTAEQITVNYSEEHINKLCAIAYKLNEDINGQPRASKALKFGLGNKTKGFNIFVSGQPGLGQLNAVLSYLEKIAANEEAPKDWVYVNNFDDLYNPIWISLPKGKAKIFRKDIKNALLNIRLNLSTELNSKSFQNQKENLLKKLYKSEFDIIEPLKEKATKKKFAIKQIDNQINAFPVKDGKILEEAEFEEMELEEKTKILAIKEELKFDLSRAAQTMEDLHLDFKSKEYALEQKIAKGAIDSVVSKMNKKYKQEKRVLNFLDSFKEDILENLQEFLELIPRLSVSRQKKILDNDNLMANRYEVNIIVDNSNLDSAPIVFEQNPSYENLFGRIERESINGTLMTNLSLIRGGALHKANGGYLILPIEELLKNYNSWESLKRTLKNSEIKIEEIPSQFKFMSTIGLNPEDIALKAQVILIGDPYTFHLLSLYDRDFSSLFKVKAAFENSLKANDKMIGRFLKRIQIVAEKENLKEINVSGKIELLKYAHRLANDQIKFSAKFEKIIDIYREADHYSKKSTCKCIDSEMIKKAIFEYKFRSNIYQQKFLEMVERKEILLDLGAKRIGQINGLAVVADQALSFGRPNKITVSVSKGNKGIIDIEREVKLGGPIHSKGVMIIRGFLSEKFGRDKILSLSSQIVFEQNYSGIDGDSASCAELYALISGISRIPIAQGIAVTGSVNQKGEIQAVGGINEKIEGYFEICSQHGLNGEQGVIIPFSNVKHLVLNDRLVEAIANKQFNIWAIKTIEEGLEILTGIKPGKMIAKDRNRIEFEIDSIYDATNRNLVLLSKESKSSKSKNQLKELYQKRKKKRRV